MYALQALLEVNHMHIIRNVMLADGLAILLGLFPRLGFKAQYHHNESFTFEIEHRFVPGRVHKGTCLRI